MPNFGTELKERKSNGAYNDSKLHRIAVDDVVFYCNKTIKPIIQVNGNNCNIINGIQTCSGYGESKGLNRAETLNHRVRSCK